MLQFQIFFNFCLLNFPVNFPEIPFPSGSTNNLKISCSMSAAMKNFFTSGSANNLIFSSMSAAMKEVTDQEVVLQLTFFVIFHCSGY